MPVLSGEAFGIMVTAANHGLAGYVPGLFVPPGPTAADDVGLPAGDPEHPSAAGTDQDRRVRLLEQHHPVDPRLVR
jgi:hypothetical protein